MKNYLLPKFLLVLCIATFSIAATSDYNNKYFEISKNLEIFSNLYKELNTYYVDDVDPARLMRTGIDAMLKSLDPYTNYISEAEIEGFRFMTQGTYGGIGAIISKRDGKIIVTEPYEGFAADKAGLKAGDEIISVNGEVANEKNTDGVSNILKGTPGTEVVLKVKRPGDDKTHEFKLLREKVRVPNVPYYGMINENIGYITLTTFTEQAGANVANALKELKADNDLKGVIFDLRGNGGGLLNEAVNVSNVFIPRGEEVVVTRGKIKEWDRNFKTHNDPVDIDIPLVVLINRGSASASEIVSGVIQDLDRGVLVGQKSYGKGLVQNTRDIGYNSKVKLTTAKYYIPSGRCIQAIDYKDGKANKIADSLYTTFYTKNGRTVLDGAGIYPDVDVKARKAPQVLRSLQRKHLIFEFATRYYLENKEIIEAKKFELTEQDFNDFVKFIEKEEYNYSTQSEKALKSLKEKAMKENYYEAIEEDIETMSKKIEEDKSRDLFKYKEEIMAVMKEDIVARYYLQKGRIEAALNGDPDVDEALSLFNDPERYARLLEAQKK